MQKDIHTGRGYLEVQKDYLVFTCNFVLFKLVLLLLLKI